MFRAFTSACWSIREATRFLFLWCVCARVGGVRAGWGVEGGRGTRGQSGTIRKAAVATPAPATLSVGGMRRGVPGCARGCAFSHPEETALMSLSLSTSLPHVFSAALPSCTSIEKMPFWLASRWLSCSGFGLASLYACSSSWACACERLVVCGARRVAGWGGDPGLSRNESEGGGSGHTSTVCPKRGWNAQRGVRPVRVGQEDRYKYIHSCPPAWVCVVVRTVLVCVVCTRAWEVCCVLMRRAGRNTPAWLHCCACERADSRPMPYCRGPQARSPTSKGLPSQTSTVRRAWPACRL